MHSAIPPASGSRSPLDDALDRIHTTHLEYGPGFSDHAPMVVEALDLIGRSDTIAAWLADYAPRLDQLGERDEPDESTWVGLLDRAVATRPWTEVVLHRVPQLATVAAR